MLDGHDVTLVDQALPGAGASGQNGAQLSYSYVQPLADPAIWRQLPKLLFSPSSPLKIRPKLDTDQWRWACEFLLACRATKSIATTEHLLSLACASRMRFEEMLERERIECDFSPSGKLVLYRTDDSFGAGRRQMELQRRMSGVEQLALSAEEVFAIEPILRQSRDRIAGAIYTPSECAADCQKVCTGMFNVMRQRGVKFHLNTRVTGFEVRGTKVGAAQTENGTVSADSFVVALGAASRSLAQKVGVRLPLYPMKGYSITVDIESPERAPRVSVTDYARKIVFARIGSRLRIAGMAELVGEDSSIPPDRVEILKSATQAWFGGCSAFRETQAWTGLRPATPTGEPIVGRLPGGPSNLLFNTGHGALGFTLAFGTAHQLAAECQEA